MYCDLERLTLTLLPARLLKYPHRAGGGCLTPFWYYATSRGRARRLRLSRIVSIETTLYC